MTNEPVQLVTAFDTPIIVGGILIALWAAFRYGWWASGTILAMWLLVRLSNAAEVSEINETFVLLLLGIILLVETLVKRRSQENLVRG